MPSEAFTYAVQHTLAAEGLWSNHPSDRGGKTKFGITEATARRHRINVENITRDEAVAIYHADYWTPLRLDDLKSRWVAAEIFDTAVNMGPGAAAQIAQLACGLLGAVIPVDGRLGPQTVAAINNLCERYEPHLLAALQGFQFQRYVTLYRDNPERHRAFIKGWMLRLLIPGEYFLELRDHAAVN